MSTVALLGYGRFGRALGSLLEDSGMPYRALDPGSDVPPSRRASSLGELSAGADIIVLAVPVPLLREALVELRPFLRADQLVLDVGSVKLRPTLLLEEVLGTAIPWVATHPLFGPISLARAERPLRVVLCPSPRHLEAAKRARSLYEQLGCTVIEQTPEGHDRIMAYTHALTFFVAKGMLDAGAGEAVPFAPPSFQAIARTIEAVRADAGHLFRAIQDENPFAAEARQHLLAALISVDQVLLQGADSAAARDSDQARLTIPNLGERSPELREAREHIDAIDREIVALLGRRVELARRAAQAKAAIGQPVLDPGREASLLSQRRTWATEAGLDERDVDEVFRAVVRLARRVQTPRGEHSSGAGELDLVE